MDRVANAVILTITIALLIVSDFILINIAVGKYKTKKIASPVELQVNFKPVTRCLNNVEFGRKGQAIFAVWFFETGDIAKINLLQSSGIDGFDKLIEGELNLMNGIDADTAIRSVGRCYYFYSRAK